MDIFREFGKTAAMFSVKKISLSLLSLATLAGCAFSKDDAKKKEQITNVEIHRDSESVKFDPKHFTVFYEPRENFQEYFAGIKWPAAEAELLKLDIAVDAAEDNDTTVQGTDGSYKIAANSGEKHKLKILGLNPSGGEVFRTVVWLDIPEDLELAGPIKLKKTEKMKLGRVLMRKNLDLNLNGYDLDFTADALNVETGAKISTFQENATSEVIYFERPHEVHKSPKLTLTAKKAQGQLELLMRGYSGQKGADADDLPADAKLDGKAGEAAIQDSGCRESKSDRAMKGQGGFFCPQGTEFQSICQKAPTNGSDGLDGMNGFDGERGEDGGSTGDLKIAIANHADFKIALLLSVGEEGVGGRGGRGQPGGLGGAPGANTPHGTSPLPACQPAQAGKPGKAGSKGHQGPRGLPGKVGSIELSDVQYVLLDHSEPIPVEPIQKPK